MANLFTTLNVLSITILKGLSSAGEWFFTYSIEIDSTIYTPVEIMLGAGLVIYLTFTLIKYVASIFA